MYYYSVEFGVHLAELTVDQDGPLAVRQLASVLLKQYVEAHWSSLSEKVRPPVASDKVGKAGRGSTLTICGGQMVKFVGESVASHGFE